MNDRAARRAASQSATPKNHEASCGEFIIPPLAGRPWAGIHNHPIEIYILKPLKNSARLGDKSPGYQQRRLKGGSKAHVPEVFRDPVYRACS